MKKYIDADALKAKLRLWVSDCIVECDDESADVMRACIDLIDDAPAADVEPVVRGEWIEQYDECECPVCGETWNYCDNDTERFDCCPKCGARLVEHGKEREGSMKTLTSPSTKEELT